MRARAIVAGAAALAACGRFQDPNTAVDLRVLAMTADLPEQIVDVDLRNPPPAATLLAQLRPAQVCALATDPNFTRRLRWSMQVCNLDSDGRCSGTPRYPIGDGVIDAPDTTVPEPMLCATIPADGNLLGVLLDVLHGDDFFGLGGLDYGVELRLAGEDFDPTLDLFAFKQLRVSPKIPKERTANTDPYLQPGEPLDASVDGATFLPLPMGRCVDQPAPLVVMTGQKVRLAPIEGAGTRETYVVPTLDGKSQMFTEALTYQWIASGGGFSAGSTGGKRDAFGNSPPLFTDWKAPAMSELVGAGPHDFAIWVIQRDERYGAHWYETCIRVMP